MTINPYPELTRYSSNMTDCDCFAKNCKRQFGIVKTDRLLCEASPPSPPIIFTEPPASPSEASKIFEEMSSLENETAVSTQPYLTIDESVSTMSLQPEVIIHESPDVYKVPHELVSDGEDDTHLRRRRDEPEVITIDDSKHEPEVITIDDEDVSNRAPSPSILDPGTAAGAQHRDDDYPGSSKKIKLECARPDTPRPEQGYSDEDERSLQMYQEKLLRDSLTEARNTYVSLTDLLLYKLRRMDFNSETPKDMLACLKVLSTLNRLYKTANLELDRHKLDDFGAEFFDI